MTVAARQPEAPGASVFAVRHRLAGAAGVVGVGFTAPTWDFGDAAGERDRAAALEAVRAATGCLPLVMHQVHGAEVQLIEDGVIEDGVIEDGVIEDGVIEDGVIEDGVIEDGVGPSAAAEVDGLVTGRSGIALLVRAADCVPVLLADADAGLIAAVHAGRNGVARDVVGAAVARLRALGAGQLHACIGPHVCGGCYEVPAALRDDVALVVPEARSMTSWGTPALDLGAGVMAQLARAGGVDAHEVGACTRESPDWPSYRRDGARATRFAGVVWRS